jgi:hypothetical protein
MLHVPTPCEHEDEEVARDLMVAYVTRSCAPEQGLDFETHCLSCEECLAKLAIVICLLRSPLGEEDERALAPLYTTGVEAAMVARQKTEMAEVEVPVFAGNQWLRDGRPAAAI